MDLEKNYRVELFNAYHKTLLIELNKKDLNKFGKDIDDGVLESKKQANVKRSVKIGS